MTEENCICENKEVNKRKKVHSRKCKSHNRDLYRQDWYIKNKTSINKIKKVYNKTSEAIQKRKEREKQYHKLNKHFHIACNLRSYLYITLKRYSKTGKAKSTCKYGINLKAIIEHLKPFPKDIKNYHVDHIIPLSLFDFNKPRHIKRAFAPQNHQWLTIKQNLEKNNRLVMPHYPT